MEPAPGSQRLSRLIEHALSAISSTTSAITRFIRAVRSSHADLSAVTHELADLRLVLELLRDDPSIPPILQSCIPALLDACGDSLVRVDISLTHCADSTQWMSGPSREDISTQQGKLTILRQALALALEVVTLVTSQTSENDANATRRHVITEVERIRQQPSSDDEAPAPALSVYLDAIIQCVGRHQAGSHSAVSQECPVATDLWQTSIESGLGALHLQERRTFPGVQSDIANPGGKSDFGQFETPGPWYPSGSPPLPNYSPYPQPVSFEQLKHMKKSQQAPQHHPEQTQGLHSFQHSEEVGPMKPFQQTKEQDECSPFVRPLFASSPTIQSSPSMQQQTSVPASIGSPFRPSWASNASPSSKPESFGIGRVTASPGFPQEPWSEHLQGPRHAQSPSAASIHSRNPSAHSPFQHPSSIRSGSSGHGHSPNISLSSLMYPFGPGSPELSQSGSLTPALSYQRPATPRSINTFSDQRPSTPRSIAGFSATSAAPAKSLQPHLGDNSSFLNLSSPNPPKHATMVDITPTGHLADKGKNQDVAHIDMSPTGNLMATRHANKYLKIWSIPGGAIHTTLKITTYTQPQPRSREYFVRSHAILSENASLIGVSTHFGLTLEIYNFSKGGSGAKKVQVIDDAHRWAASQLDAYHTNYAPLVVYRPKGDRIDRFFLTRHPGAKKPFWEDATNGIDLTKADLPFLPKFPELAYSANSPLLVAAAGPRPGEPPRPYPTILIAWQMPPISDAKLQALSPVESIRSADSDSESHHRPYRVCVPEYSALQTALPSCLAARGSLAVSIWIPANHTETQLPGNKYKRKPMPAPERFVLSWDVQKNTTNLFAIPNVQACVSPDCRRVAYCDANAGRFIVLDAFTGDEIWRWPDAARNPGFGSYGLLESLHKVTVFEFTADGQTLMVGDVNGGIDMYSVREAAKEPGVVYELQDTTADHRFSSASLFVPLVLDRPKISELES